MARKPTKNPRLVDRDYEILDHLARYRLTRCIPQCLTSTCHGPPIDLVRLENISTHEHECAIPFPKLASQFTPEHAQAVLADAIQFLQRFRHSAVLRIAAEHDRIRKDFDRALSTLEAV